MSEINDILKKTYCKETLSKEEKFKILHSKKIDPKVIEYLREKLNNLYIEALGEYDGALFELMYLEKLIGWCWETTESAIVFLNDDDYIERGNLYLDEKTPKYYHSWICFNYNSIEYVLDPCLNLLCKKDDYHKIFEADVLGKVYAMNVKKELIKQITTPKKEKISEAYKNTQKFLKFLIGDSYEEYNKNEVTVHASEDVNAPLYRNSSGYKSELEDGKIKKLTVHYYYPGY